MDSVGSGSHPGRSMCGDVDGDGLDEIVLVVASHIWVISSPAPGRFERVCWMGMYDDPAVDIYDLDGNGYNEVVICGRYTDIHEIEAIRLTSLNDGEQLRGGDTVTLSWETYSPPWCQFVGLYLRQDTSWQLDTIVHRLNATESTYTWVVPELYMDSCWIVAIAYQGDKWQYDECDRPISIRPSGIAEGGWPLTIRLARVPSQVRGILPLPGERDAELLDITGRRVMDLQPGENDISRLSPGVYFVREEGPSIQGSAGPSVRKIVVQR
jgi:hypothetical protein